MRPGRHHSGGSGAGDWLNRGRDDAGEAVLELSAAVRAGYLEDGGFQVVRVLVCNAAGFW